MLVLEGKMRMIVGDEERIVEPGTLVHIPRNTRHGVCAIGGPAVFFAAKSPVGTGDMAQDYNKAKDADEVWKRLSAQPIGQTELRTHSRAPFLLRRHSSAVAAKDERVRVRASRHSRSSARTFFVFPSRRFRLRASRTPLSSNFASRAEPYPGRDTDCRRWS